MERPLKPRPHLLLVYMLLFVSCFSFSCSRSAPSAPASSTSPNSTGNIFEEYLNSNIPPADGFDFAVGDRDGKGPYFEKTSGQRYAGWYVATHFADNYNYGIHTGEDWS